MKAEIFVVTFCLLLAGGYFTYFKHKGGGSHESNMVISSDHFYEEINYSGDILFTPDESALASISRGGYLKFRRNGERFVAESVAGGGINYTFYEGEQKVQADSAHKKIVTEAVKEMIAWGYRGQERMDSLFKLGGNARLLYETDRMKNNDLKKMYFEKVLQNDSLSAGQLGNLLNKITGSMDNDNDKAALLKKINPEHLADSPAILSYYQAIESLNNDDEKQNLLKSMIEQASHKEINTSHMLAIIKGLGSDDAKAHLLGLMIRRGVIADEYYNELIEIIGDLGNDNDKQNLYDLLTKENTISSAHWASLINASSGLGSDFEKSRLLVKIANKMPKTDSLKRVYLNAAKNISDDMEYGKTVRPVE